MIEARRIFSAATDCLACAFLWAIKPRPLWQVVCLGIAAISAVPAIFSAFEERRPVAAFSETFVAHVLNYGTLLIPVAAGVWVGGKVANKHRVLGWIVGITVFISSGVGLMLLFTTIPGVGWRIEKLHSSSDY